MLNKRLYAVYLVRCSDGSLYCGITTDVGIRMADHNAGQASRYTRARLPVTLEIFTSYKYTKSQALKIEYRVKTLTPPSAKVKFLKTL